VYAYPPGSRREKIKETEMRSYVYAVYRHGSNAANQSLCNKRIVGTVTATSREEACKLMAGRVTVYRNQWLSAVPFSRLGKAEQRLAAERDEWLEAEREWWRGVERDVLEAGC
jgi:hypothetical protein